VCSLTDKREESLRDRGEFWKSKKIELKRSMKLQDNERILLEIIQSLDSKYQKLVVVVEGHRDEAVLRSLGVKAPIIKTQSRLPRYRIVEKIASKASKDGEILILTDYDQEGKDLCNYLERELELSGIKTLRGVRIKIRKYMATWRCIEEFVGLLKRRDSPEASHYHL